MTGPAVPEPIDLGLTSAHDLLSLTDEDLGKAFQLKEPAAEPEPDGEPGPDAILEPLVPETPAAEVAKEGEPAKEPEKAAEPAKEPAKEEAPKPVAEFQVFDKEGELEVPPDLTLTYKANGKVRENVPLDRVVRLAQMGEYNEEREEQVRAAKHFVPQLQERLSAAEREINDYKGWFERVLSDEAFRTKALENWAVQNTPEARLARAEERVRELEARQSAGPEAQDPSAFVATHLVPRVTQLIEQHPTVSFEEVIGRFNLITAPLMVRGQVPPNRLPDVQRAIESELLPWVQQRHATRELESRKVANEVEGERNKTTLAKRQLSRATQPAPVGTPPAPKPKTFGSVEEWLDATLPVEQAS